MQVAINTDFVAKRKRMYRRTTLGYFLLFVIAFLTTFLYPNLAFIAWPLLVIAFVVSNLSRQIQFETGVPVTTEDRLERALKPLSQRYWLGSYVPVGRLFVDHMLIGPEGVLVIEPRNHTGATKYVGGKWRRRTGIVTRLLGIEPSIGNPVRDLNGLVDVVRTDLEQAGLGDVPVSGALVFTATGSRLELEDCPVTALTIAQLSAWASSHQLKGDADMAERLRHRLVSHYAERLPGQTALESRAVRTSS